LQGVFTSQQLAEPPTTPMGTRSVLKKTLGELKITCDEFVHDKIPMAPDLHLGFLGAGSLEARAMLSRWLIAAWLSGYHHAKRNNWIIALKSFEDTVSKLTNYCYDEKNFQVPIVEAVERVLGK